MISAQNSTVQCGQAIAKGGCAQRPFFTIQPARLPPKLHWLKKQNKTKHCFYLPTQEPTTGPNCLLRQGPTPLLGSQGPPVSAPLRLPLLSLRLCSPFPTAFPLLPVLTVLPGLEDLASIPVSHPLASGSVPDCSRPHSSVLPLTLCYTPSGTHHLLSDHTVWWNFTWTVGS